MSEHVTSAHARKRAVAAATEAPGVGSIFEVNRQTFDSWIRGVMEISQEMVEFTQARFQEDAAAWMKLAACRSPDEAMSCQQRFAETAAKQYLAEAEKLSQLIVDIASGVAATKRHEDAREKAMPAAAKAGAMSGGAAA